MADQQLMTPPLEEIHVIFKTHLDIGFTDFSRKVTQTYFEVFIPQALKTARILREEGRGERFIWTTGSWLVYEYLEQADAKARRVMEAAIALGDLIWHGLPFTTHSELMDASLFRYGLSLSQQLDRRFGKKTIAAKMTDVPGHTRAIVPLLAGAGIQLLHLGVNPASTPPDVPPVFVWKDAATDSRVIVMYQKGSYGNLMLVPGLAAGLAFAHTDDNHGPQTPADVHQTYNDLRRRFPDARIFASTLDAFAARLSSLESTLPVVTQEMGDTWIHGVGSDPGKVARFRALSRLRRQWLEAERVHQDDPVIGRFSRALLLVAEHTWGLDVKTHLRDYTHYDAAGFRKARSQPNFQNMQESWDEQRGYIGDAFYGALAGSPLQSEARRYLGLVLPPAPLLPSALSKRGFRLVEPVTRTFETAQFEIGFDPTYGAITHLRDRRNGRAWATARHPLALFRYQTFSQADYDGFYRQYIVNKRKTRTWAMDDFTKPGLETAAPESCFWLPQLSALSSRQVDDGWQFIVELDMPDESHKRYGSPRRITAEVYLCDEQPHLAVSLHWQAKPATRLAEALWFSFVPQVAQPKHWQMDKMGQRISPLEVLRNGNRKLHAVDTGVYYADEQGSLSIETLDAPLVAPGEPSLLNFNNRQPPLRKGMHFNLYNNVWGTNFPMWYGEAARFRFKLTVGDRDEK